MENLEQYNDDVWKERGHSSPFDRGGADSWYRRPPVPHWYPNGTGRDPLIEEKDMTEEQIADYWAGWHDNESDPSARKY